MIAKVEPLAPARALRGPSTTAPVRLAAWGWAACWWCRSGRRRLLGVVVEVAEESELPPERLVEPLAALEAEVPQGSSGSGCGWRASTCRHRRAGSPWCCRPAPDRSGAGRLRARRSLRAALTAGGRGRCRRRRTPRAAPARRARGAPGRPALGAAELARQAGAATPRCGASRPRADPAGQRHGPPRRPRVAGGGARGRGRSSPRPSRPPRCPEWWSGSTTRRPGATAATRRDGQRQDRGLPARRGRPHCDAAARRSCSCRRSR